MTIQWQARTFHRFGKNDSKCRIVYHVPCSPEPDYAELLLQVNNAQIISIDVVNAETLSVEVEFNSLFSRH